MDFIDLGQFSKLVVALIFVVALMGGLAMVLKKLGLTHGSVKQTGPKRLKILESIPLDPRRRAIILQCDDTQHLVILGPNGETVVQTHLKPPDTHDSKPS